MSYARHFIFLAAALLMAVLLYFFIRKLIKNKPVALNQLGILFSTLGFILGSAVSLEAANPQLTKEAKSQKNQMQKNLERENRISVLKKYLSWKQFKQFWKKLNQLSLNKNSSIPVLSADPDLIKLFERLRPVYKKWKEIPEKYLSLTERKVLQTLTEARVKYLRGVLLIFMLCIVRQCPMKLMSLKPLVNLNAKYLYSRN